MQDGPTFFTLVGERDGWRSNAVMLQHFLALWTSGVALEVEESDARRKKKEARDTDGGRWCVSNANKIVRFGVGPAALAPLFGREDGEGSRMLVGSCLVLGQALQASSLEAFRDVRSQMRRKAIAGGDCRAPDARSCDIVIVHPNLLISTILEMSKLRGSWAVSCSSCHPPESQIREPVQCSSRTQNAHFQQS